MSAPSLPAAAGPESLTRALQRAGMLADGRVRDVSADAPRDFVLSRIWRLRLAYDGDAAAAPPTLILKARLPQAPGDAAWGSKEVAFYRSVAPATPAGLVPRCFEAEWQAESREWHLLLEDLTDTHRIATRWPLPPSEAECRAIVGALARFHAAWWDDQRLGVSVGAWIGDEERQRIGQYVEGCYRRLADRLGDALSAGRRALYERFLANGLPRIGTRYRTRRHLSIVHGDAHAWNTFLPNADEAAPVLFDWDGWRLGLAAYDLAYLMATHWYPERRRRFEQPMLDHYHATMVVAGVAGYDRAALAEDYRLGVLMQLFVPLVQADSGIPPVIWWPHLERVALAVDDLGCRDLLA
jgi:hypothetical protein